MSMRRPTLLALTLLPTLALPARAEPPLRTITVTGSGDVRAVPDEAQLSAGVVSEAKTADAALSDNRDKMNAVFTALKALGVPDKNIQTSDFSVSPQYPPYNSTEIRHITGYQVANTVSVRLDDMKLVGPALDALVAAGANQINNVAFSIADPKPLLAKARVQAVHAAEDEAQTFAKAAGVTLGPIQTIAPGGGIMPRPVMMQAMRVAQPTPISPGETTVSASATITWQIK